MTAGALENERIFRRDGVEVVPREHSRLVREVVLVPAHAVKNGAGSGLPFLDVFARDALHVGNALRVLQAHVGEHHARVEEVLVRIDEARNDGFALGIPDLDVGGGLFSQSSFAPDGADDAVLDEESLFKMTAPHVGVRVADKH